MATFWERAVVCIVTVCGFGYFQRLLQSQDFGSDCISSWSLFAFCFEYNIFGNPVVGFSRNDVYIKKS